MISEHRKGKKSKIYQKSPNYIVEQKYRIRRINFSIMHGTKIFRG